MAELSKDTQAIIKRLVREGELNRFASEKYSIKAVRSDLAKFQGTFDAIRESMAGVQSLSTEQSEYYKQKAEKDLKLEDLNEEEREEYKKQAAENLKRDQSIATADIKHREKLAKERDKSQLKIFGKDGILLKGIKKTFSLAFIGAIAAVGYSFVGGLLKGLYPETFGEDGTNPIPTVFDIFRNLAKVFKSIDYDQLAENLAYLSSPAFLGAMTAAGATAVAIKGLGVTKDVITTGLLARMFLPTTADADTAGNQPGKGGVIKKTAIRVGVAGVIFSILELAMPAFTKMFSSNEDFRPEKLKDVRLDQGAFSASNQLTNIGQAATIGSLFAPTGPVGMAIAGFVAWATLTGLDALEHAKDDDKYSNNFEDAVSENLVGPNSEVAILQRKLDRMKFYRDNLKLSDDEAAELDEEIQTIREALDTAMLNAKKALLATIEGDLEKFKKLKAEDDRLESLSIDDPEVRNYMTKDTAMAYGLSTSYGGDPFGVIRKSFMQSEDPYQQKLELEQQNDAELAKLAGQIAAAISSTPGLKALLGDVDLSILEQYRSGTNGFKNFGNGKLAMLHGEEAVIPRGSLEGQILEGLRSGSSISAMTDKIATAMTSTGNKAIIVNNVNNSSNPISVQSSQGGARVAHTRIGGGGGGGSYIDMPGLIG